ncbi:MAG: hypothetical protein LBO72_07285 [Helicobacteraceae bacterium]|jgi:hypothetical protein|nr:hypothetical protein [Helicobacteraceae bacterium]
MSGVVIELTLGESAIEGLRAEARLAQEKAEAAKRAQRIAALQQVKATLQTALETLKQNRKGA